MMRLYAYMQHALTRTLANCESLLNLEIPRVERWLKRLRCPLAWLLLAAAVAAVFGVLGVPNGWLICGVLIALTALGVVWPLIAMKGISAEVEFAQARCFVGDTVDLRVNVRNRWPIPIWRLTLQTVDLDLDAQASQHIAAIIRVPAACDTNYRIPVPLIQRGRFPRQSLVLVTGFPFGLLSARRVANARGNVIVRPRPYALRKRLYSDGSHVSWSGELSDACGDEGSVCGARNHRDGEPLRRIHWAHSARRRELIVCERQAASHSTVLINVENSLLQKACRYDELREIAVRIAATVAAELLDQGNSVACRLGNWSMNLPPGRPSLRQLLDGLALFDSVSPNGSSLSQNHGGSERHEMNRRRSHVVSLVVSIRDEEDAAQAKSLPVGKTCLRRDIVVPKRAVVLGGSAELNAESAPAPLDIGEQICSQWNREKYVNVA